MPLRLDKNSSKVRVSIFEGAAMSSAVKKMPENGLVLVSVSRLILTLTWVEVVVVFERGDGEEYVFTAIVVLVVTLVVDVVSKDVLDTLSVRDILALLALLPVLTLPFSVLPQLKMRKTSNRY